MKQMNTCAATCVCAIGMLSAVCATFFFFNDTATTEIYTLSLHDALPILKADPRQLVAKYFDACLYYASVEVLRSEEHTSELQSRLHLVCRLLLEKKKKKTTYQNTSQEKTINV